MPSASETAPSAAAAASARRAALPRWLRHATRVTLQLVLDGGAVSLAYCSAYWLRFHSAWILERFPLPGGDPGWIVYGRILYALVPLWVGIFWYDCRLYASSWKPAADRLLLIVRGVILGTVATMAGTLIYNRMEYSRLILLLAAPIAIVLVSVSHAVALKVDAWLSQLEATSPLLLIGGGRTSELVRDNLLGRHPGLPIHSLPEFTTAEQALKAAADFGARDIVLTRSLPGNAEVLALAEACESADINLRLIPDLLELRLGELQMDDSLGLLAYRIQHTSLTLANYAAKRVFDLAFSACVLAALGLPLALIALLIRLDSPGPALYRQKRLGYKGRVFDAFKFRTMRADAEAHISEVRAEQGGFFKLKEDPRVTRIGRLLRRFSLDEFPQFLNVLRGEMSVVGPRPLAVTTGEMDELVRQFGTTAKKRMNMLPGITGLWQVSGRSDVDSQQRFALDMFYIERWSLGLDLHIILKTIPAMLFGKGAY